MLATSLFTFWIRSHWRSSCELKSTYLLASLCPEFSIMKNYSNGFNSWRAPSVRWTFSVHAKIVGCVYGNKKVVREREREREREKKKRKKFHGNTTSLRRRRGVLRMHFS